MLEANGKSPPCFLTRLREGFAAVTCLFLSGIFLGCHPTPKGIVDRGTVGRLSRPIDADPSSAELIGREALAKIGYIPLINLARQAGWVTTQRLESPPRNDRALLAMGGAAVGRGFIEVYSKYAVAAGVTSQLDSPLPGPGDAMAIGILVFGLLDAGLLEGAFLDSLGDLVSDATGTTTPAAATAAPTATAVPVPTVAAIARPRKYPNQTCEEDVREELGRQKDAACKAEWTCKNDVEKLGKKNERLLTCPELLARIAIGQGCLAARNRVQSECFKGSPDPNHDEQIKEVTKGLNKCIEKAAIRGIGGGPC